MGAHQARDERDRQAPTDCVDVSPQSVGGAPDQASRREIARGTSLFDEVCLVIDQGRRVASAQVNATTALTYWHIGRLVHTEVLRDQRGGYGAEVVSSLARRLVSRYGRSFQVRSLRRMIQFAQVFPDEQIVSSLTTQLTWTHIVELLPLKTDAARAFYAQQVAEHHLSVRELRGVISRKAFERREIADSHVEPGSAVPLDTFKDPYLLDFLGLTGAYQESDLETAILREMEKFLLEVGKGFSFVERQKRISIDSDDFYLDLLFFSRPLRRLVAVELKVGKFKPAHEGYVQRGVMRSRVMSWVLAA